jgi:hypothetical protein
VSRPRRRYGVMTARWGWQPLAWEQNGLPSWRWRNAPAGLLTRRQMRAAGLAPGGAGPVGQVVFTHRRSRRVELRSLLWDRTELVAKRVPTPAQLAALDRGAGGAAVVCGLCPRCRLLRADLAGCLRRLRVSRDHHQS